MNRFVLLLTLFVLSGCSQGVDLNQFVVDWETPVSIPTATLVPSSTVTPSPIPTATIDFKQTAIVAQQTSDEAMRLNIMVTAEQDRRVHEQLQWTQEADRLTAQSDMWTASQAPTSIPGTLTASAIDRSIAGTSSALQSAQMTQVKEIPTQIVAEAEADALASTAEARSWADVFVKFGFAFSMVVIGVSLVIIFYRRPAPVEVVQGLRNLGEEDIIPFAPDEENENHLTRGDIHVPVEILIELAEGITERNMTLAFGQWEGTDVHKYLNLLRHFLERQKFAYKLTGKGGELGITALGENWLRRVVELQSPPPPYVCVVKSPPPASQA